MQPGQTINPNDSPETTLPQPVIPPSPDAVTTPVAESQPPSAPPPAPATPQTPQETTPAWQYTNEEAKPSHPAPQSEDPVKWTASEFIDHDKRATWFIGLAVIAILCAGFVYVVTNDFVAPVVILIASALFGVTGGRKPQTLTYGLDDGGITIGPKHYMYDQFKSFSVIEEGAIYSIQLTPLARLAPPISLYYPPDQEEQIVGMLANFLPHEDRNHDPVDRLMRRIRF